MKGIRTMSTLSRENGNRPVASAHPSLYRGPKTVHKPGPTHRELEDYERQYFKLLREDMVEMDAWVKEGIPGAADFADKIRVKLLYLSG